METNLWTRNKGIEFANTAGNSPRSVPGPPIVGKVIAPQEKISLVLRDILLAQQQASTKFNLDAENGFGALGEAAPRVIKPVPMPLGLSQRAYGSLLGKKKETRSPRKNTNVNIVDCKSYKNDNLWKVHTSRIYENNMKGIGSVLLEPTLGRLRTRQKPRVVEKVDQQQQAGSMPVSEHIPQEAHAERLHEHLDEETEEEEDYDDEDEETVELDAEHAGGYLNEHSGFDETPGTLDSDEKHDAAGLSISGMKIHSAQLVERQLQDRISELISQNSSAATALMSYLSPEDQVRLGLNQNKLSNM